MLSTQIPARFPIAWSSSADPSYVRTIPQSSQIGINDGAASLADGFPPKTFYNTSGSYIPPSGADFNGIFKQITEGLRWNQAGGQAVYDSAFAASIGGYPKGAILQDAAKTGLWINTVDGNTTNPDTGGANWTHAVFVGFTPVEQGGGTGQTTNKLNIGWSPESDLKVSVDGTPIGALSFRDRDRVISFRGQAPYASIDSVVTAGYYAAVYPTDTRHLLVIQADGSTGVTQIEYTYTGTARWRNLTNGTTWSVWREFVQTSSGQTLVANGSQASPGIVFNSTDLDTGFFRVSDGVIGISCNNTHVGSFASTSLTLNQKLISQGIVSGGGNQASPGITLNPLDPDTGIFWQQDGYIGFSCNGTHVGSFYPSGLALNLPITAPTPANTDNSTRVQTTAGVRDVVANVLLPGVSGSQGWQKYPSGTIKQWGSVAVGDIPSTGSSGTWTYPIPFPNEVNSIQAFVTDSSGNYYVYAQAQTPGLSSVVWRINEGVNLVQNATIYIEVTGK